MEKSDLVYLKHIIDAIDRISEYLEEKDFDEFKETNLLKAGVIREIEIIGEASKKISENLKEKYKNIPWKRISGMRDKLIHHYFGVDIDAVYKTSTEEIPKLKIDISAILIDLENNNLIRGLKK